MCMMRLCVHCTGSNNNNSDSNSTNETILVENKQTIAFYDA